METATRVLIVDDRARSRKGLKALLSTCSDIDIVGEAGDGWEAVRRIEILQPDVVLMDAKMPVLDGVKATGLIKTQWDNVRVVILTIYPCYHDDAVDYGADAFLIKGCPVEELLEAILDLRKDNAR